MYKFTQSGQLALCHLVRPFPADPVGKRHTARKSHARLEVKTWHKNVRFKGRCRTKQRRCCCHVEALEKRGLLTRPPPPRYRLYPCPCRIRCQFQAPASSLSVFDRILKHEQYLNKIKKRNRYDIKM